MTSTPGSFSRRDFLSGASSLGTLYALRHVMPLAAQGRAPASAGTIEAFFDDFTAEWVRNSPNLATASRYFTGEEQERLEQQVTPETLAWRKDRIRLARQGLARLAKFDRASLTQPQRISAEVMEWLLDIVVQEEPYLDYTFPLEQFGGANVRLPNQLTIVHPLLNEKDASNYLAALGQVGARMEEAVAESRRLADKQVLPPRFILLATAKQMQGFIGPPPAQNPFVTVFAQKMSAVNSIPEATRETLRAGAEKIVAAQVYPAWMKAIALLESQSARATDDAGLWRFKPGAAIYAYNLRRYTTTNLTANEIHEVGLRQVSSLEAQMDGLLRGIGRADGSVKERIEKLSADLRYPNPASDESRKQIMDDINGILNDAQKRAALLFDKRPKSPVIAQPFPRFRESNAAANYTAPAADGSRPGIFQFPLRPENMTKLAVSGGGLRSLVYHESVPGHHFQIAYELENKDLPRFRQIRAFGGISALSEGWGLYAEHLVAESGWYQDDPAGRLGQLNSELFRARRLVVDTGLHAQRWTRQQAIDYGIEASEVERYVVNPGQACSYMIGELKIIELREKARKALGDRFSLRAYHDAVLDTGTVPLNVLERRIDAYIVSASGKP